MAQVIQIRRRTTGAAGAPASLQPGELAYNYSGNTLLIGDGASTVQVLVSAARQVEITGAQTITGNKTISTTNLKLTGGAAGNLLSTDGAGNISFVNAQLPVPASNAEMDAGTRNDVFGTPLNTRSLVGASVATLTTTAKTLVPAINELKAAVDLVSSSGAFLGSFQADAGTINWTAASGGSGNSLPPATPANNGSYLVCDRAGSVPPGGAPVGAYNTSDWLISDGTAWTHLAFGGSTVTASSVSVTPSVAGGINVQAALQGLDSGKLNKAGDTMSGMLVLPSTTPTLGTHATNKAYVDALHASQDGTINDRVRKTGDTMTGMLTLSATLPTLDAHAASKTYVDNVSLDCGTY
jgi:hypothetical protein